MIREEQRRWQDLLEHEPVHFYEDLAEKFMEDARRALAAMLKCDEIGRASCRERV